MRIFANKIGSIQDDEIMFDTISQCKLIYNFL